MKRKRTNSMESVSLDEIIAAVADEHRRAVIRSLGHAEDGTMDIETISELVAKRVQCETRSSSEHRDRIRIALHHTHLPKLAKCGMIQYDTETRQIQNTTGELEQHLLSVLDTYEREE